MLRWEGCGFGSWSFGSFAICSLSFKGTQLVSFDVKSHENKSLSKQTSIGVQ
jgi:hypothetical protein